MLSSRVFGSTTGFGQGILQFENSSFLSCDTRRISQDQNEKSLKKISLAFFSWIKSLRRRRRSEALLN
jgi:hypothetical protein